MAAGAVDLADPEEDRTDPVDFFGVAANGEPAYKSELGEPFVATPLSHHATSICTAALSIRR